jgi:hypothetical protein
MTTARGHIYRATHEKVSFRWCFVGGNGERKRAKEVYRRDGKERCVWTPSAGFACPNPFLRSFTNFRSSEWSDRARDSPPHVARCILVQGAERSETETRTCSLPFFCYMVRPSFSFFIFPFYLSFYFLCINLSILLDYILSISSCRRII